MQDPADMEMARITLQTAKHWDTKIMHEHWRAEEMSRKRKLPIMGVRKRPPGLSIKNQIVRKAAIHWYTGTFPILPSGLTEDARRECAGHIRTLHGLMVKPKWDTKEREMAENTLQVLKEKQTTLWQPQPHTEHEGNTQSRNDPAR